MYAGKACCLSLGSLLQVGSIASGPTLVGYGHSAGVVILTVLLGFTVGERFLSMTSMVCVYEWTMFRATPMAAFMHAVSEQTSTPQLPAATRMHFTLKDACAVYTSKTGVRSTVELPDLEIGPGINIIQGESGVGKSTLVGVLSREISYEGDVRVGGLALDGWDVSGRIVNGSQAFHSMEVPQWLLFEEAWTLVDANAFAVALDCAAYPEMDPDKLLSEVSGGQRRRAMLAAVIYHVVSTDFGDGMLIVDEPTNDLDPKRIRSLARGFRKLARLYPELTIIIPTHEGKLVSIGDQRIVLYGGSRALVKRRFGERLFTVSDSR
jgi:ABC-type lipoprotein export system ATPase subunit